MGITATDRTKVQALPKWAQDAIASLEHDIDYYREAAQRLKSNGSRVVFTHGINETVPVRDDGSYNFYLGKPGKDISCVRVRLSEHGLKLAANDGPLLILPQASNCALIDVPEAGRWHNSGKR
jgi:hypothetical protein